jgi:Cu/Ag efflux protein CusF
VVAVTAVMATAAFAEDWTKATIKARNAEDGKITLNHETLKSLDMAAMTMTFAIDPALLKDLKEGDAVEIEAVKESNGQVVVKKLRKP